MNTARRLRRAVTRLYALATRLDDSHDADAQADALAAARLTDLEDCVRVLAWLAPAPPAPARRKERRR